MRCVGGGDGAGVGAGFSTGVFSKETLGGVVLFVFSLPLATAFCFEGFDEPPMKLFNMPHLPLVGSSSGKSVASVVNVVTFCSIGSGTGVDADGFRW